MVDPVLAKQQATKAQAKVETAKQALASANSIVDEDRRNHSPGCVACDQKLVDRAQVQLDHARIDEPTAAVQTPRPPGSTLDFVA